jgi:hypothetical protein
VFRRILASVRREALSCTRGSPPLLARTPSEDSRWLLTTPDALRGEFRWDTRADSGQLGNFSPYPNPYPPLLCRGGELRCHAYGSVKQPLCRQNHRESAEASLCGFVKIRPQNGNWPPRPRGVCGAGHLFWLEWWTGSSATCMACPVCDAGVRVPVAILHTSPPVPACSCLHVGCAPLPELASGLCPEY